MTLSIPGNMASCDPARQESRDNELMHGFQHATVFAFLEGLEVQQICLGLYETQIRLHPDASISLEGRYVHQCANGREIVQARSSCGPNILFRLLGKTITEIDLAPPASLRLSFSNGDALLLIDDSQQYESFVFGSGKQLIVV